MVGRAGGAQPTHTQRWWREKRLPEVEEAAYAMVQGYEARHGSRPGCVFPPELLLGEIGCRLEYFTDEERPGLGIPADAIGALDQSAGIVYVLAELLIGREWHTVGEEVGHDVLHAKGRQVRAQLGLGLEIEDVAPMTYFTRRGDLTATPEGGEARWQTIEASFFAACVCMPKDRYLPAAERRLREAVLVPSGRGARSMRPKTLEERVAAARPHVQQIAEEGWSPRDSAVLAPDVFDTHAIDMALDLLTLDHGGQVSKAAQRRRFVELGLAHDAARLLLGAEGEALLPRFQFLFVSERVVREMLQGTQATVPTGPASIA